MVAFSKMLAAGVVASFGVAGVSAKQGNDFESLLANPEILAKMPAGQGMHLVNMMKEMQSKTPEEIEEMEVEAREMMYKMMEQMEEMQEEMKKKMPEIKAQLMDQVDELKNADSKSELVQKQFDAKLNALKAQLDALKDQLEAAQSVEEKDEFDNFIAVDTKLIADLKAQIADLKAQISKMELLAPMEKNRIAQLDNDTGKITEVIVKMTDVVQKIMEKAQTLPENPTKEEEQAIQASMTEEMNPIFEDMGEVFRQTLSHLPAAQREKVLAQLTGPGAGPMAGIAEALIEGKPLNMEEMEEEIRQNMYAQLQMQEELEEAEARLEEEEAGEDLMAIKKHQQELM